MGVLKLGGLSSGMDTEGLIKTLMALEKRPLTSLQKKRDTMSSQASAWRDLNSRLLTLQKRVEELQALTTSDWTARKASVGGDTSVLSTGAVTAAALNGTYTVEVVSLASATTLQSGQLADGADADADPDLIANADQDLGFAGTIRVATGAKAGATFDVQATDSLNDIVNTINSKSADLGFNASVVQVAPGDYRLVLKGTNGAANDFTLEDSAGTAATDLRLVEGPGMVNRIATAANGQIKVNGVAVTTADNTVKDAIGGVTLTVNKVGTATVTVSKDYGKVVEAVRKVVEQYNNVVDLVDQQTSYDAKTKQAGVLFGEDRVRDVMDSLRSKLFGILETPPAENMPDDYQSLGMVGVSAEKFKAGEKASRKLVFDSEKFTKALDKDPVNLRHLFMRAGTGYDDSGVAVRLRNYLDNYTRADGILSGTAKALDQGVELVKKRITWIEETSLPAKEKHLRAQFTALEKSMAMFQNQGSWLSSQVKGLASWAPQ